MSAKEPTKSDLSNKQKAVSVALAQIEKRFGKGSIMKMGDTNKINVETIPSGSISLDIAHLYISQ